MGLIAETASRLKIGATHSYKNLGVIPLFHGADALMEAKKDLASFDKRHPGLLPSSIKDLKEARNHIFFRNRDMENQPAGRAGRG